MAMNIQTLFNSANNSAMKYRGHWSPSSGALPSMVTFPIGSVLVASTAGTVSSTFYPVGSIILNTNNSWELIGGTGSNAPITFTTLTAGANMDDFIGVNQQGAFTYQIVNVPTIAVSGSTNLPIDQPGVLEVFGNIDIQRYTTQSNLMYTRHLGVPDQEWAEITVDLTNINNVISGILEFQYTSYSISGIPSE